MRLLLFLTLFFINLFAIHVRTIDNEIENGKTALITFAKQEGIKYESVTFGKKEFPIINSPLDKESYFVLLPVSYYEKAESKEFYVNYLQGKERASKLLFLDVRTGIYKHEEILVDSSKVNPKSKLVQRRVAKEYNQAMKIYNTVTPKLYISKPFDMPLESKITSDFGKARIYNGSLKGYHSGTDFRAKVGTPIKASNDGKVVLVAKRFYSGGTILIDHGYGIYTCYFHMSKFDVKEGELVQKGQVIGLSGQSGRVTGPHLHFSARINGIQVDPLQLISLLNTQILKDNN
ncbi:M23 family metallopeptidase [Sulfurimonas microaerophilic]|uniref:M23 family metallopeptidase n=1 Tax=Sulfurimonas microaerophilic TaxID=3058392 RepID=UPI002714AAF4|nr:M23 family metallopeptidase [Sulfurimonas sp. hsl 1-7]